MGRISMFATVPLSRNEAETICKYVSGYGGKVSYVNTYFITRIYHFNKKIDEDYEKKIGG